MNKHVLRNFAIAVVFLAGAIVSYSKSTISLGAFIRFFLFGAAFGVNLINGINSIKWKKREK